MHIALFTMAWSSRELWSTFCWPALVLLQQCRGCGIVGAPDGSQREFCQRKQEGVSLPEYVFTGLSVDSSTSFQLLLSKGRALMRMMLCGCHVHFCSVTAVTLPAVCVLQHSLWEDPARATAVQPQQ